MFLHDLHTQHQLDLALVELRASIHAQDLQRMAVTLALSRLSVPSPSDRGSTRRPAGPSAWSARR